MIRIVVVLALLLGGCATGETVRQVDAQCPLGSAKVFQGEVAGSPYGRRDTAEYTCTTGDTVRHADEETIVGPGGAHINREVGVETPTGGWSAGFTFNADALRAPQRARTPRTPRAPTVRERCDGHGNCWRAR